MYRPPRACAAAAVVGLALAICGCSMPRAAEGPEQSQEATRAPAGPSASSLLRIKSPLQVARPLNVSVKPLSTDPGGGGEFCAGLTVIEIDEEDEQCGLEDGTYDFSDCTCNFGSGGGGGGGGGAPSAPTITGVSPSPLVYGSGGTMTIFGSGLGQFPGTPAVTLSGTGIALGTPSVSGGTIKVSYQVTCATAVAAQNLTVSFSTGDGVVNSSNSWSVPVTLPSAPAPTIDLNGSPVSGTQSAVVGQQISLTASQSLPTCMNLQSQTWTPPSASGTPIGGYVNAAGTGPPDTTGGQVLGLPSANAASYTFYWTTAGNPLSTSYQYTMVDQSDGSTSSSQAVAVAFNVSGVSSPTVTLSQNYVLATVDELTGCSAASGGPYLVYGNISGPAPECPGTTTGSPGIQFSPGGTPPGSGIFEFVQLVNSDTTTDTGPTGPCVSQATPGLDGTYPYQNGSTTPNDAPEAPLPSSDTQVTRAFSATMYLLWQSTSTANSVPVPLAYIPWVFNGTATQSSGEWIPSGNGGPTSSYQLPSPSPPSYGYPTWSGIVTEPQCTLQ